jgi:hypothetical protein
MYMVTYFVVFQSGKGGLSDRFEEFYDTPPKFVEWVKSKRKEVENVHNSKCSVISIIKL